MNNIDQIPLVRLRPDKFDDIAVKEHISLVNPIANLSFSKRDLSFDDSDSTSM